MLENFISAAGKMPEEFGTRNKTISRKPCLKNRGSSETTRETPEVKSGWWYSPSSKPKIGAGPAAAVIQRPQALSGFIGRKESVGVSKSFSLNPDA